MNNLSKNLLKYKIQKKTGDLDYSLIRHNKTPLTEKELEYCYNDVLVLNAYIQELLEDEFFNIGRIPNTKTGYVRRYVKKHCLYGDKSSHHDLPKECVRYKELIKKLTISDVREYRQLKRAFQGGFTHSNALFTGYNIENVASYDITSSYPYVMLSEKFPMSKGTLINPENRKSEKEIRNYLDNFCCIFDIELFDIYPKSNEHPLSMSKCEKITNGSFNNGRVVSADYLMTTITNVDFKLIERFYNIKRKRITNLMIYTKNYLPTLFVESIIDLYKKKTELKNVKGKEAEYMISKGMLNSSYGMAVMDPIRDIFEYDSFNDEWHETELKELPSMSDEEKESIRNKQQEEIDKYNKDVDRFLYYPWGVFVTAYARYNLFSAISDIYEDYVYSDTDSIKFVNAKEHETYFSNYNKNVVNKLKQACEYHGIQYNGNMNPKTIKGVEKIIGVWDYEKTYPTFKTLGAKRYMTEEKSKINGVEYPFSLTVSGITKEKAIPYLFEHFKGDLKEIFEEFRDGMIIPKEYSGKPAAKYIKKAPNFINIKLPRSTICNKKKHITDRQNIAGLL